MNGALGFAAAQNLDKRRRSLFFPHAASYSRSSARSAPTVSRTAESSGASNGVPDTIAALYRLPAACQASLRRSLGQLAGERFDRAGEERRAYLLFWRRGKYNIGR